VRSREAVTGPLFWRSTVFQNPGNLINALGNPALALSGELNTQK
jgi:hypothetical protein